MSDFHHTTSPGSSKPPAEDLTGRPFGRWTVIRFAGRGRHGLYWFCRCSCGRERAVAGCDLLKGRSKTCGCFKQTLGGMSSERLYRTYRGMVDRCVNPGSSGYEFYGAKGVSVAREWLAGYPAFREWAMAHGYDDGLTIERNDPSGPYSPENCCWIPASEQRHNRRRTRRITAFGETKSISRWVLDDRCLVNIQTIRNRVWLLGWDHERAITTPMNPIRKLTADDRAIIRDRIADGTSQRAISREYGISRFRVIGIINGK